MEHRDEHDATPRATPVPAPSGPRGWSAGRTVALVLALAVGLPVLGLGGLWLLFAPRPVVTTAVGDDGREVELRWAEHPGQADVTIDEALDGPSLADGLEEGAAMVAEMQDALSARSGVDWTTPPGGSDDQVVFPSENGWGGPSLLRTVNLPTQQTTSVPEAWSDKQEAVAIIGEVAARHGWSEPVLDDDRWPQSEADRVRSTGGASYERQVVVTGGVEGPHGQWLAFGFQDLSKDVDGRFTEDFRLLAEQGWEPDSLTLSYGANALLPEADRAEFERRAAPFAGQEVPPGRES